MPHVDDGTLHALLDGALRAEEPERARQVEAHLETCADCRARLEQAESLRDQAAAILGSVETPPAGADFQEVLARAARSAGTSSGQGPGTADRPTASDRTDLQRRYRWTRGLAWAATIVVALGAGYMVRDIVGPAQPDARYMVGTPVRGSLDTTAARFENDAGSGGQASQDLDLPQSAGGEGAVARVQEEPVPQAATRDGAEAGETGGAPGAEEAAPPGSQSLADAVTARAAEAEQMEGFASVAGARTDSLGGALKAAEADAESAWVHAELAEAEARVGPLLVLPNARIEEAELAAGGEPVARTLQRLPGGVEVHVVQAQAPSVVEVAQPAGGVPLTESAARRAPLEQRQPAEVAAQLPAEVEVTPDSAPEIQTVEMVRDGVLLTVSGPVAPEVLRALAAEAAPRTP